MERLTALFRTQPILAGLACGTAIMLLLGIVFAVLMTRAGLSLRPLVFVGVFFAIIIGPQLVFHVLRVKGLAPDLTWTSAPRSTERSVHSTAATATDDDAALAADEDGKFLHPEIVFGPGFDPDLLNDIRRIFETAPVRPSAAQMAVFKNSETAVAVRFSTAADAHQGLRTYAAMMGVGLRSAAPDGSFISRRATDLVRFFVAGRTVFAWCAADNAALDRRMVASSGAWRISSSPALTASTPPPPRAADPRSGQWLKAMIVAVPLLMLTAALWFFKGAAWAATVPAVNSGFPASKSDLRSRLLAVDALKQPVSVTPGAKPDELVVTWRTDAAWIELARARSLKRVHKLVLQLDEASHAVRVREYFSSFDASGGRGGLNVAWRTGRGVTFFQYNHHREFGLRFDASSGRLKPAASYAYTFNLQELKAPFIAAIIQSGWDWKPVLWNAPDALRWLTN